MLNVGIAGLGKMGKLHFLNALKSNNVNVVAVADLSKSNRKSAEKYHIKSYKNYQTMIDAEKLDAIIISLPNFLKKESLFYSSDNNLDIFIDKPFARSLKEAEEMIKKIESKNIKVMVGVNYRYFDSFQKVKKIIEEGNIGEVVLATSELIMDGPFSHPLVPSPVADWWFSKEKSGGGALLDLGYHLIDLFCWMFGDLEVEFSSLNYRYHLPIEDAATVILKSKKTGIRCTVNTGWFSKMIFPDFNFRINMHGTVGYISTDEFAPKNLYFHAVKEGTKNFVRKVIGRKLHYLSYTYYYSSFVNILNLFFESINKDLEIPVKLDEQLSVMKSIEMAYKKNEGINID